MGPRELCQISVGHLAVTDDSLGRDIGVRDIVRAEFMPRIGSGAVEDLSCHTGWLTFADEQSYQAALSDRARREVFAYACEPVLGGIMVNMILNEQGGEHVRVEENGHLSSSSSRRTSSLVIVLPRCATGRPVRALLLISPTLPELSPRRISPATA